MYNAPTAVHPVLCSWAAQLATASAYVPIVSDGVSGIAERGWTVILELGQ